MNDHDFFLKEKFNIYTIFYSNNYHKKVNIYIISIHNIPYSPSDLEICIIKKLELITNLDSDLNK